MSNYYDMRDAKVRMAHELMGRGWKVYGYKKDESDSMTDYYSPANWDGVATKKGFVLCVDIRWNSNSGKDITKYNPKGNLSFEDRQKISKLEEMTTKNGCTEGEEKNAKKLIEKIQGKNSDISAYEVVDKYPEFMVNPGRCKWHIEKDGKVYDKGTGLTKYASMPDSYIYDIVNMEFKEGYKTWGYGGEKRELTEDQKKIVNDFKSLILRFERVVNSMNGMGDGTKETEQQAQKQQNNEGYEKVIKQVKKKVLKMVEVEIDYFREGDYITLPNHGHYWKITKEYMQKGNWQGVEKMKKAFVYEIVGSASRGYKPLKNPQKYYDYEFRMIKNLQEGKLKIYELKEVEEIQEIEKWEKIDKKVDNTHKETNKNEFKTESKNDNNSTNAGDIEINSNNFTITESKHTKTGEKIYICKLVNKVSKEEFKSILADIKTKGGYYSSFVSGFVFKNNPAEMLNNSQDLASVEEKENTQEIKDNYIYSCHFKEWNLTANELKKEIEKMNLGVNIIDLGNKIGFSCITADQTRILKELSDKNGSIFFIDLEISKEEFEQIESKIDSLLDTSVMIIKSLGLNSDNYYVNEEYKSRLFNHVKENFTKEELQKAINVIIYDYNRLGSVLNSFLTEYNRLEGIDFDKLIERINKNIDSFNKKLNDISGNYKTNTHKRMREEESRENAREFYRYNIKMLEYLRQQSEDKIISAFEISLINNTLRDNIATYSRIKEAKENGNTNYNFDYPKQTYDKESTWYQETERKIKRLQNAGIYNIYDLEKAVNQYNSIIKKIEGDTKQDQVKRKIKKMEMEYKLQQKGDINFTPLEVVEKMIEYASIDNNSRVLEPSAGIGSIADKIKEITTKLDCIEKMCSYQDLLKLKGHNVVGHDILQYNRFNYYDVVIMNPPFSKNQDIEHIRHAYKMLKPGGKLVAICSPHYTFASDKQSQDFREWIEDKMINIEDLKSGTFEMTNVSSKLLVLEKLEENQENAI